MGVMNGIMGQIGPEGGERKDEMVEWNGQLHVKG